MSGAIKNDSAKPDLSLIPFIALKRLAEAMMVGAKKYKRYNYCQGMEVSRQIAAIMRHASLYNDGEDFDADGQHHLGSIMANCLMILRQEELGTLIDDRYKPLKVAPGVKAAPEAQADPEFFDDLKFKSFPRLLIDKYRIVAVNARGTEVVWGEFDSMSEAILAINRIPDTGEKISFDIRKVGANDQPPAAIASRP